MKSKSTELPEKNDAKLIRKILLGIFFFTFLLYGNSLRNNYALDDNYVTVTNPQKHDNPRIEKGLKEIPKLFRSYYVESADQNFDYRPLPLSTFAIEYQFFGSNPHVSHFFNILIFAFSCMLFFVILTKIFKDYHILFPLLTTTFFVLHPIHTEVVNNIKCRDELMAFGFGLTALYFYLKSINSEKQKRANFWAAFSCLFLAFLCKRTAILFMVLIPLITWFFSAVSHKKLLNTILFLLGVLVTVWLFKSFMLHNNIRVPIRRHVFYENPVYIDPSYLTKLKIAVCTCGYYLKLFLIPYPLSCYYGYDSFSLNPLSFLYIVAFLFYLACGIYAIIKFRQKALESFLILFYLLGVLPFSNFLKPGPGIVAERFIYFGSAGFCAILAFILFTVFKIDIKHKKSVILPNSFKFLLVFILLFYSALTFYRNGDWKDKFTLYRADSKHFPDSYFLHYFLANAISNNELEMQITPSLIEEAKRHYARAASILSKGLETYKNDYLAMCTLGTIYNQLNNIDSSLYWFQKSLLVNPNYDVTKYNIFYCYERKNSLQIAKEGYEQMVRENTNYPPVYFQLHELYVQNHAYKLAILTDQKAINILPMPFKVRAVVNLGNDYVMNHDTLLAIKQFTKAQQLDSLNLELYNNLANAINLLSPKKGINN